MRDVRFVKAGVARALRTLRAAASPAPDDRSCRSRRKWWGCGLRRRPGPPASSRGGDRPLGPGRSGVGAHEPGRVDDRRDARRELEDEPDGGALLGRADRRAGGCGAVSLSKEVGGVVSWRGARCGASVSSRAAVGRWSRRPPWRNSRLPRPRLVLLEPSLPEPRQRRRVEHPPPRNAPECAASPAGRMHVRRFAI